VHHRVPGVSTLNPLLLVLWREQHPDGPEQTMLASNTREAAARAVPLASDDPENQRAKRGE
jgi:hypothetical protein